MTNYTNENFNTDIIKFIKDVNNKIDFYNNKLTIRNSIIDYKDLFYFLINYNIDYNSTYINTNIAIFNNNVSKDVSYQAYIKKRNNVELDIFIDINNSLISAFYNFINLDKNKPTTLLNKRIISCDGSQLNFLYSLNNEFKSNKHSTYTLATLSCLYDVDLKLPIDYLIGNEDERTLLINQLHKLNNNDILVADRGYFSDKLLNKLIEKNINFCLRISKHNNYYINNKTFINENDEGFIDINYNEHNLKLFWFKTRVNNKDVKLDLDKINNLINLTTENINNLNNIIKDLNEEYELLHKNNKELNEFIKINKNNKDDKYKSKFNELKLNRINKNDLIKEIEKHKEKIITLQNNLKEYNFTKNEIKLNIKSMYLIITNLDTTIDNIKEIYKKRWEVEIHFRFCKKLTKINAMNNTNIIYIKQNLFIIQFIFILESYLEYILNKKKKSKNKMLSKSSIIASLKNKLLHEIFFNNKKNYVNDIIILLNKLLTTKFDIKITVKFTNRIRKRPCKNYYNVKLNSNNKQTAK